METTFGFLIVLDGATSHLTAFPCKSTSPLEVTAEVHEWMDTLQMNPKAIYADMPFHQPHDMQAFCPNAQGEETTDRTAYFKAKPS